MNKPNRSSANWILLILRAYLTELLFKYLSAVSKLLANSTA